MKDQQTSLKLAMLRISEMTGIEYTNDLQAFHLQLHQLGFITDEENKRFEQIGLQL